MLIERLNKVKSQIMLNVPHLKIISFTKPVLAYSINLVSSSKENNSEDFLFSNPSQ